MYKIILDKIKQYKKITIFHHKRPDGDAVFSSYALYEFIRSNFKDKKVYLAGKDSYDVLNSVFNISDSNIKNSLCFILDTATKTRIDDQRTDLADYIIKIDHHPTNDNYGDINIIKPECSATCEVLSNILFSKPFKKYKLNSITKKYLFCGLVSDTISFRTASCTKKTFTIASLLLKDSNFNIADIYNEVFSKSESEYTSVTKLRNYYKSKGQLAYIIAKKKDLDKIGLSYNAVKNNVDILSNIKGIKIWAIFVYNKETKSYDGSIRSMHGYVINDIAARYNGGGHKYAAGVKNLKNKDVNSLIIELNNIKKVHK